MNDRCLRACRREATDCTPVWFMRQAGRYLPEYRAIREKYSLLDICARPEIAAQVTLQPVEILGVDAAILFADILLPLIPMGINLEFAEGEGPVIHNPIRTLNDVNALRTIQAMDDLANVMQTIRLVRRELNGRLPLIGFAGAPFTLASYLIEGGASRTFRKTKQFMYGEPQAWHALMGKLTDMLADYLCAQVAVGAQAVQLFDSWVGCLSPDDYLRYVLPYSQKIFRALKTPDGAGVELPPQRRADSVPTIHFGTDTATLLPLMREAGGDVMGLDWRVPLDAAWRLLGAVAVQGNLDPVALFAPRAELLSKVRDILKRANGRAGHIFNLGHGILPETPVDNVRAVVDMVHEFKSEQ